jgi:hypothetical protein
MLSLMLAVKDADWQALRDTFRSGHVTDRSQLWSLALAAFVLVGLLLSLYVARVVRERHLKSKPYLTFHEIAGEMGIGLADQWLLVRIARQQALPSPLTLLMSGATLRHHANAYASGVSARRREKVLERIREIGTAAFS